MRPSNVALAWWPLAAVLLTSCGGFHSPPDPVSLSLRVESVGLSSDGGLTATDGTHTLVLNRLQVVFGSAQLESPTAADSFGPGPFLAELDLSGAAQPLTQATFSRGDYSGLKVAFRHLDPGHSEDAAAVANTGGGFQPLLDQQLSFLARGTFDGTPFSFSSATEPELDLAFTTLFHVSVGLPATAKLRTDPTLWFRTGGSTSGALLNPGDSQSRSPIEETLSHGLDTTPDE